MYLEQKSENDQRVFFDTVYERSLQAQAAAGRITHVLDIAGTRVQLNFAGDRLEQQIMPALSHLCCDPAEAFDVSFNVWDSESTGISMPPPPCAQTHFTDRGDIWGYSGTRFRTAFHWIECSVSVFDR